MSGEEKQESKKARVRGSKSDGAMRSPNGGAWALLSQMNRKYTAGQQPPRVSQTSRSPLPHVHPKPKEHIPPLSSSQRSPLPFLAPNNSNQQARQASQGLHILAYALQFFKEQVLQIGWVVKARANISAKPLSQDPDNRQIHRLGHEIRAL